MATSERRHSSEVEYRATGGAKAWSTSSGTTPASPGSEVAGNRAGGAGRRVPALPQGARPKPSVLARLFLGALPVALSNRFGESLDRLCIIPPAKVRDALRAEGQLQGVVEESQYVSYLRSLRDQ